MKFTEIHGILQSAMSLKGPKVSFLLPYGNDRHRLGVNKILLSQDQNTIYTAGRDGCLKSWNLPQDGSNPAPVLNIQAHYDWINDMFLTKTSDESPIAVTCSNDSIIQFWNLEKSTNLATYRIHNDYIRCMAYSQFANTFISCGLDSTIYFSDLEKAIASGKQNSYEPTKISLKSSIYACALNDAFSLCVTGGTDTFLRLHDPKSLKKICKLRGHSDNIHSILMSQDGNRIVSAGSNVCIQLRSMKTPCFLSNSMEPRM
jgi:WD repeat-containing protein 48